MTQSMIANYSTGRYYDAERLADKILGENPRHAEAHNVKGGIAYYRRDFERAREYFEEAHRRTPSDVVYTSNLAYAQIESGAFLQAIETAKSIGDGKSDTHYLLGRAYLYAGRPGEAEIELQQVPDTFNNGAAGILEAAAIISNSRSEESKRRARGLVNSAFAKNPRFWERIMDGIDDDESQTYNLHSIKEALIGYRNL